MKSIDEYFQAKQDRKLFIGMLAFTLIFSAAFILSL